MAHGAADRQTDSDGLEQLASPEAGEAPGSLFWHPPPSPDPSLTFGGLQDRGKSTNRAPCVQIFKLQIKLRNS